MTTDTTINAAQNPSLANQLVEKALTEDVGGAKPAVLLPPDPAVELPGGWLDPFLGLINTAEVRELIGSDEEAISKVGNSSKALLTILERATVKIGDEPSSKEMLDSLYAGDREMLLLSIRSITFGSEVEIGPIPCPFCEEEQTFKVDLSADVPIKKLEGPREFTVACKVWPVVMGLPTGHAQKEIVNSTNKTSAELDTILLKNCITSINGNPMVDLNTVRNLSLKDRRALLEEIINRNPGPQLGDIKKACKSCGQEVPLPLTLAGLF